MCLFVHPDVLMRMIHSPHRWADKLPYRVGLDTWEASPWGDFTSEEYNPFIYWLPNVFFLPSCGEQRMRKTKMLLLEKPLSLYLMHTRLSHGQTVIYLKHNFIHIFEGCKVKTACNSQPILCLLCAVFQTETRLLKLQVLSTFTSKYISLYQLLDVSL